SRISNSGTASPLPPGRALVYHHGARAPLGDPTPDDPKEGPNMHPLARRWRRAAAVAAVLTLAAATGAAAETVLRIVPQADLKILDTVWTTNNITSNHGYMVYDVLFAPNAKLEYKPQMIDTYSKSADGLVWKFKLRDGLKFSDGSPVEGKDVVASLKRWC